MPAMLRIDTLKFARSLSDAGMDPGQAEALVRGLSDADTSDFVTRADAGEIRAEVSALRADMAELQGDMVAMRAELKTDMAELRAEFKNDMAELRAELKGDIADLRTESRTEIASLRAAMSADRAEMFRFMYLQTMGIVGLTTGLTVTLIKLLP